MRYNLTFVLSAYGLFTTSALAAGGGGSVTELISPAINFLIFASILYWVLKDRVRNYFSQKAGEVGAIYKEAQSKEEEAKKKLRESEEKIKNLPQKLEEIHRETERSVGDFEVEYQNEVAMRIKKLKEDSQAKIKAEETSLTGELNSALVNLVLVKTKSLFGKEKSLRDKATKKMIKGITQ